MTAPGWAAGAGARALVFVDAPDPIEPPPAAPHGDIGAAGPRESPIAGDAERWIDGPDGHHLQRVRRLEVDETVVVADGAGVWYPARIAATRPGAVHVVRSGDLMVEPVRRPRLTIGFGPARQDHGVEVVRQLVELGVDEIVPLLTRRGVVRWEGERARKPLERLRRVAREAAMQCQRARLPVIAAPSSPVRWRDHPGVVVGARDGHASLGSIDPTVAEWVVLVGPEGGFATEDLDGIRGDCSLALGPHTLRAVTAAVAIAAALVPLRAD